MRSTRTSLLFCIALASNLSAQGRTWVVDMSSGPGTDFTDLPPALLAAHDGDTIMVRAGAYSPSVTGKALTILGQGASSVSIAGSLTSTTTSLQVSGLAAGKHFTLSGVSVVGQLGSGLVLSSNQGTIHLDQTVVAASVAYKNLSACNIQGCALVTLTACSVKGDATAGGSRLVLTDTTFKGYSSFYYGPGYRFAWPGLTLTSSSLVMRRGQLLGGNGGFISALPWAMDACPGLQATDSQIFLCGTASISAGTPYHAGVDASAIVCARLTGIVDPQVVLTPGGTQPKISGSSSVVVQRIADLETTAPLLGTTMTTTLTSSAGDAFAAVLAPPHAPIAGFDLPLCVDPATMIVVSAGVQPASGATSIGIGVPKAPALVGLVLALQAVNVDKTTARLGLSNPTLVIVR